MGAAWFLDTFILWVVRIIRKRLRITRAQKWSIADGSVLRTRLVEDGSSKYRPVADYSFELDGESYLGQAQGYTQNNERAADLAEMISAGSSLKIRYNPADPTKNLVLNGDNPRFPVAFEE